MTANNELVVDYEGQVSELLVQAFKNHLLQELILLLAVDLHSAGALRESASEAHENLIFRELDCVKALAPRLNHSDWFAQLADVRVDLVDLDDLLERAALDQQVLVRQQADVVQVAQVLDRYRAVCFTNRLSEVEKAVIVVLILEHLPRNVVFCVHPGDVVFLLFCVFFVSRLFTVSFLWLLFLFFVHLLLLLNWTCFAIGFVVPFKHDWLGSLDVVLALTIDVLEEVQAAWQHEAPHTVLLNRALAQVLEVVLRQGTLLGHPVGRLAAVGDDDIFLRALWLPYPLLLVDQEAFLLDRLLIEASRRRRLLELLSAAIEDGDDVAAIRLRHAPQHLLERIHALAVQHAVRAIVHHAVPGVIDEKKRTAARLVVLIDACAGLVNGYLELLVVRVFQNLDLAPEELEFEKAREDDLHVFEGLRNVLKAFLALDLAELGVIPAPGNNGLLVLDPQEGRTWHAHEILIDHLTSMFKVPLVQKFSYLNLDTIFINN